MMKLYINPLLVIVLILIPLKTSAKVLWCENTSTGKKTLTHLFFYIWDRVFKNGPNKTCARQPLKNLKGYGLI